MHTNHHCPQCGAAVFQPQCEKSYRCERCQFTFFVNTATAVLAIIMHEGKVLIATRAREPSKGMWDLPGGFVDYNETLEQALVRELNEELQLDICPSKLTYVGSEPNQYRYKDVLYHTCDCFFYLELTALPSLTPADDVAAIAWHPLTALINHRDRFAFSSAQQALLVMQQRIIGRE